MRICSHRLEIETGRYKKTVRNDRLCKMCSTSVEYELHFLLKCPLLEGRRIPLTTKLSTSCHSFEKRNNLDKFYFLIDSPDPISPMVGQLCAEMFQITKFDPPKVGCDSHKIDVCINMCICIHMMHVIYCNDFCLCYSYID
jgi:hypothetical protein